MRLGVASAVVGRRRVPGDVEIADGMVVAVGTTKAGDSRATIAGFVDLQVNGFGEVDFLDTDAAGYQVAAQALALTGVTAYQPTFISSPEQDVLDALDVAAAAQDTADGAPHPRRPPGGSVPQPQVAGSPQPRQHRAAQPGAGSSTV